MAGGAMNALEKPDLVNPCGTLKLQHFADAKDDRAMFSVSAHQDVGQFLAAERLALRYEGIPSIRLGVVRWKAEPKSDR
jgi:hypothetical protein